MIYIVHSAKGSTWKKHKYLKKVGAKYIYAGKVMVESLARGVENIAGSYDRAKDEYAEAQNQYKQDARTLREDREKLKHQTNKTEFNRKLNNKKIGSALKKPNRKNLKAASSQEKKWNKEKLNYTKINSKVEKDKKKVEESKKALDKARKKLENHPISRIKKLFT